MRPENLISTPRSPLNDPGLAVPRRLSFSSVERGKRLPCPTQRACFEALVRQLGKRLRHWKAFCKCNEMALGPTALVVSPSKVGTTFNCHLSPPTQQSPYTRMELLHSTFWDF